jgi:hypothetical protein
MTKGNVWAKDEVIDAPPYGYNITASRYFTLSAFIGAKLDNKRKTCACLGPAGKLPWSCLTAHSCMPTTRAKHDIVAYHSYSRDLRRSGIE